MASLAMLVTDELLSSAATTLRSTSGRHYRAELPRDTELLPDARHQVALGCDGRYLAGLARLEAPP